MKPNKDTVNFYLFQLCYIIVTAVICFAIYRWGSDNDKACFALTLGAIVFLFLCFYNIIFSSKRNNREGMVVGVLSGLTVIAFANKLYDYEKLKTLIPILSNVDPMIFTIIVLGGVLFILLLAKLFTYIYDNDDNNGHSVSSNDTASSLDKKEKGDGANKPLKQGENENANNNKNTNGNKVWTVLYVIFLTVIIVAVCAGVGILYQKGVLKQNYDFFEVVTFLLNYAGSLVMIILGIVIVIIFLIEMARLIVSRMKAFANFSKGDSNADPKESPDEFPLYALSAVVDIIVCYLTYKFTDITIDSFYDFAISSKYLALPLLILLVGIAFTIFLRLTHATLSLLAAIHENDVRKFLSTVNQKTKIKQQLSEIAAMLIDIVLNSITVTLQFVIFVPNFFKTIYSFVIEDECEFELGDECVVEQKGECEFELRDGNESEQKGECEFELEIERRETDSDSVDTGLNETDKGV